MNITANSMLR